MNWLEPDEEMVASWNEWVAERPEPVRDVIAKHGFTPWKLYRLQISGRRVTIHSIDEPLNGGPLTLKVNVDNMFNEILVFERTVFGVKPEELEECDLPPGMAPMKREPAT